MGKRTALLAGLAALVVLGCAAVFWDEIAARIALRRLRSEPGRILEAAEPRSSVQRRAFALYLAEEDGRKAFVSALFKVFEKQIGTQTSRRLSDIEIGLFGFSDLKSPIDKEHPGIWYDLHWANSSGRGQTRVASSSLPRALEWLTHFEGRETYLAQYPQFRFRVVKLESVQSELAGPGKGEPSPTIFGKHAMAILVKKARG
jgi:hypothetical protein